MRHFTIFLTFLLILSACAPLATQTQPAQLTSAPVIPTTAPTEVAPEPEAQTPVVKATLENSLLATEWQGKSKEHLLFPLDPADGTALPGYTPISLGFLSYHAFSPDRQTLAVVSFPNDYAYDGSLLLIDLPTWKTQRFELELRGWVSNMVFSPDATRLAIAHGDPKPLLTMVDIAKGVITAQRDTGAGFASRLKFTANGEGLILYGPAIQNRFTENEMSAGPPQVF